MTFFNPSVLFGLIAATIPLILHLLNLRKLKKIEFSSLKFLKELQKTKIKKLKLKRLLLLILRTLAIIFIVIAFARPAIQSHLPLLGNYSNSGSIILLDNSPSMNVSDEYGNRFNQAKNTARSIISTFAEGDESAVIPMADNYFEGERILSRNSEFIQKELDKITVSSSTANLEKSLRTATDLLQKSHNFTKDIYIISDFQNNIYDRELNDSAKYAKDVSNYFLFPVGSNSKSNIQNVSIDSVKLMSGIFQKDKPAEVDVTVTNHSKDGVKALVVSMYFNNAKVSQKSVDLQPNETKSILISAVPQSAGINSGKIEIESDALDEDNTAYFGFIMPDIPTVALISNQSKFLKLALNTRIYDKNLVNLSEYSLNSLSSLDMSRFDIVFVSGGPLRIEDYSRLKQYLAQGGSVVLFADNSTPRDIYNRGLSELGLGTGSEKLFSADQPAQFTLLDKDHPIFKSVFKEAGSNKDIVESPKIKKALAASGGIQIIQISGGAFMNEAKVGEGKVIYIAVPPDNEWSNFPFTGIFPTIIHRAVSYMSSKQGLGKEVLAGSSVTLNIPKKYASYSNFKLIDPNNNETFIRVTPAGSGNILPIDNLRMKGNYKIMTVNNEPVAIVSVNTKASESDIKQYDKSLTENYLKTVSNKKINIQHIDKISDLRSKLSAARVGTELWKIFVVLALLCLIAELFVAKSTKLEADEIE